MRLSAAIIVRDEAEHLDACLTSLDGLVDEIVVVDTGSTDDSVAVAERHGAVVGHDEWQADFSRARNVSLDLATGDWILYIDADERVRPGDHAAVREHLAADATHVCFRVQFVPKVGWTPYREFRLWRHRPDIRFVGSIHESMLPMIEIVRRHEGLEIGDLDTLTIDHLGYEGDQSHKHRRNEPMLRTAIERDPERVFLYDHLARTLEALGEDAEARDTWRTGMAQVRSRIYEHHDDRLLWFDYLIHAVRQEDPDGDVAELLAEAIERFPDNPIVEFAAASQALVEDDPAGAAARYERLVTSDLDAVVDTGSAYDGRVFGEWSWNGLGLARFALGDLAGAAEAFGEAERGEPRPRGVPDAPAPGRGARVDGALVEIGALRGRVDGRLVRGDLVGPGAQPHVGPSPLDQVRVVAQRFQHRRLRLTGELVREACEALIEILPLLAHGYEIPFPRDATARRSAPKAPVAASTAPPAAPTMPAATLAPRWVVGERVAVGLVSYGSCRGGKRSPPDVERGSSSTRGRASLIGSMDTGVLLERAFPWTDVHGRDVPSGSRDAEASRNCEVAIGSDSVVSDLPLTTVHPPRAYRCGALAQRGPDGEANCRTDRQRSAREDRADEPQRISRPTLRFRPSRHRSPRCRRRRRRPST